MKCNFILQKVFFVSTITLLFSPSGSAAASFKLKKAETQKLSGVTCGLVKSKWVAVKKSGKQFVLDAKNKKKKDCKALLAPSKSFRKAGLSKLPSAATLIALNAKAASKSLKSQALSGTPPLLTEVRDNVKTAFWRPGVIEAIVSRTANQEQCSEFFNGSADGQSGGMVGCYMSQGVGESFQNVLKSGTSICYMKSFPTAANQAAGGIVISSGSLPGGDITRLFSVPTGSSSRIIRVNVTGQVKNSAEGGGGNGGSQSVFISPDNEATLARSGNQYAYKLWSCAGSGTPDSVERTTVSLSGNFKTITNEQGDEGQIFRSEVSAFLKQNGGDLEFDASRPRTALVTAKRGEGNAFKSEILITSDNFIKSKVFDIFGNQQRKAYAVSTFLGSGVSSVRFLQGAYHDVWSGSGVPTFGSLGAIEYRDTLYASAPQSELLSDVQSVNIGTDSFYSSIPAISLNSSGFSCTETPDITVELDFANPTIAASVSSCEGERLDGMDFCRSNSEVNTAQESYAAACSQQP